MVHFMHCKFIPKKKEKERERHEIMMIFCIERVMCNLKKLPLPEGYCCPRRYASKINYNNDIFLKVYLTYVPYRAIKKVKLKLSKQILKSRAYQ